MSKLFLLLRSSLACPKPNICQPDCSNIVKHTWNKHLEYSKSFAVDQRLRSGNNKEEDKRTLPKLIYIQNPVTWLMNKLDLRMLKSAWDVDFDEREFKKGTKQAVSVICCLVSENLWDNLRGLLTRQALIRLQRDVEVNWSDEQKRSMCLEPSDIKLALTRRVHFLRISDQRFADVDMVFVAMKFKEKEPSLLRDVIFIEMVARFHRNYTIGQLPNWTVSLFKVTRFNVQKLGGNK